MTLHPRLAQKRASSRRESSTDRATPPAGSDQVPQGVPAADATLPTELQLVFGENLRKARLKCGLTQTELGERCGMGVAYVSKIELGQKNITLHTMQKLAEVVDHDVFHLLQRPVP